MHIRTLLLTFFYRQMPQLIEKGYIYIAQPPLYKITRKKQEKYIESDAQMNALLTELGSEDAELVIVKGKKGFKDKTLKAILDSLGELEEVGSNIRRKGVSIRQMLELRDKKSGALPVYRVRVEDDEKFIYTDKDLAKLTKGKDLEIHDEEEKDKGKIEGPKGKRIDVLELYESKDLERILKDLSKKGIAIEWAEEASQKEGKDRKPLYKIKTEDKDVPVFSTLDILRQIRELGKEGMTIQRYKGLGEMNPTQLWETTMDPEARTILKVTVEDAVSADEMFNILMGDQVEPRRKFIEANALHVRNLDI
jgi:DNA gyrase subunit B